MGVNADLNILLKEKISLKIKFRIQNCIDSYSDIIKRVEEGRIAIIKELAPDTQSVEQYLEDGKPNPDFTEFMKRYTELLNEEVTAPTLELKIEDLENITTEHHFASLQKWLNF
jgi:hypothetical protein